eukprot:1160515-Pelagomonas_calceolata.AAC.3
MAHTKPTVFSRQEQSLKVRSRLLRLVDSPAVLSGTSPHSSGFRRLQCQTKIACLTVHSPAMVPGLEPPPRNLPSQPPGCRCLQCQTITTSLTVHSPAMIS